MKYRFHTCTAGYVGTAKEENMKETPLQLPVMNFGPVMGDVEMEARLGALFGIDAAQVIMAAAKNDEGYFEQVRRAILLKGISANTSLIPHGSSREEYKSRLMDAGLSGDVAEIFTAATHDDGPDIFEQIEAAAKVNSGAGEPLELPVMTFDKRR